MQTHSLLFGSTGWDGREERGRGREGVILTNIFLFFFAYLGYKMVEVFVRILRYGKVPVTTN
jgi:hypothetical protein